MRSLILAMCAVAALGCKKNEEVVWEVEADPFTTTLAVGPDAYAKSWTVVVTPNGDATPPGDWSSSDPGTVGMSIAWNGAAPAGLTVKGSLDDLDLTIDGAVDEAVGAIPLPVGETTTLTAEVTSAGGATGQVTLMFDAQIVVSGEDIDKEAPSGAAISLAVTED